MPLLLAGAAAAQSSTYVVGAGGGPGVDFTSLVAAVGAVSPGDVLVVRAGNYSPFVLDKALTIVADRTNTAPVVVLAGSRIASISDPRGVRLSTLVFNTLEIEGCSAPVLGDALAVGQTSSFAPAVPALQVSGCADVRLQRSTVQGRYGSANLWTTGMPAARVTASRVEFQGCSLVGGRGGDFTSIELNGTDGNVGLLCLQGARVHLARTNVQGGRGGNGCVAFCSGDGGSGGEAVFVSASRLIAAGEASHVLRGGAQGNGYDGLSQPGVGLFVQGTVAGGTSVRYSGITILSGDPGYFPDIAGNTQTVVVATPPDPTLELIGPALPGQPITARMRGVPGLNGRIQQGDRARVAPDALSVIEQLANRIRIHPLGPLSGMGLADWNVVVPSTAPSGWFRVLQGLEIDTAAGTLVERTNSVFVIVR